MISAWHFIMRPKNLLYSLNLNLIYFLKDHWLHKGVSYEFLNLSLQNIFLVFSQNW